MFESKGQDFEALLVGEVERIVRYGELGYIEKTPIPEPVYAAYVALGERVRPRPGAEPGD